MGVIRWAAIATAFALVAVIAGPVAAGQSSEAEAVEVPGKPGGLEISAEPGSLKVALDWDDVDGASTYLAPGGCRPGNPLNEGNTVTSSEATIDVASAAEWVVRIEACNDAGCGRPLSQRFTVEAAPEPEPEDEPELEDDDEDATGLRMTASPRRV